jgi:hypothetical protein
VYLDEEAARRRADALVAQAREHLAGGRVEQAVAAAREAAATRSGHSQAARLLQELDAVSRAAPAESPVGPEAAVPAPPAPRPPAPARDAPPPPPSPPEPEPEPATPSPSPAGSKAPAVPGAASEPRASVAPGASAPAEGAQAEAASLSAAALRHFLKDEHTRAREVVERALALDPSNRRALELQKILRVLG